MHPVSPPGLGRGVRIFCRSSSCGREPVRLSATGSQRVREGHRPMKRPLRLRSPLTLLAAALFLALTFASTPSDPAPSDPNMTPPPAEPQELASFLAAGTGTAGDGRFHAFRPADLAAAADPEAVPAPEPRKLSLLD